MLNRSRGCHFSFQPLLLRSIALSLLLLFPGAWRLVQGSPADHGQHAGKAGKSASGSGAATITATRGTPQSATVNTPFAAQLEATVRDAAGNPVSGVTVTFTAPASGPSGTFAGGVNTATTNASGIATAPVFTANSSIGSYVVTASAPGVASPASFPLNNAADPTITVVQVAQNFSATANTSITVPITTTPGNLLVIYTANGGSNAATVAITDSASQTTWTQTTSGYASSAASNRSAMFYIPNSAAVTSVTATWTASASNIEAVVYEISGAAAVSPADGSVNSSASGSGILSLTSGSLTTTNATDILIYGTRSQSNETTWTGGAGYTIPTNGTNARLGTQYEVVAASQTGVTTSMSWNVGAPGAAGVFAAFKAAPGGASTITATVGTPQSATVSMAYGTQFQALLKDASNNPISGATVTWTAPGSGPSGTFAGGVNTATTNGSGVATAQIFTANTAAGTFNVTASATGVGAPASYSLTNLAGTATNIAATAGGSQSTAINNAFGIQLQATVTDQFNNPVSGVTVTWTPPGSGASGTFANGLNTAVTNSLGVATAAVFTANGNTGSYLVPATAPGVANPANFSLTNLATAPLSLVQSAQNFSATSNTSITVPITTTAGNLLVIFAMQGGNNTATATITDSANQTWTQTSGGYASSATSNRAAMFYVANSAAVTSVTVTWTSSANNIGAIVYEVTGAAKTSPADGSVNSSLAGSSITSLASGSLSTTNANDILIYGTRSQSNETTWTAGNGYTIPTNGSNTRQGMQYEVVGSTQTNVTTLMGWNAGAPGAAGIFAAFKGAAGGGGNGPSISSLTPSAGAVGATVVIAGSNFGGSQGSSTITFNGTPVTTINGWTTTSISVLVPAGATSGNVIVTVNSVQSNPMAFTVTQNPNITSLNPSSGPVGAVITINGANFGSTQSNSTVMFGAVAANPTAWSATSIIVPVPANAATGSVVVTVGGIASNGVTFTVTGGATYGLSVSISSSRNYYANALPGASVQGLVYVFTSPASQPTNFSPSGITSVSYWLDNTATSGPAIHTQTTSPYDYLGTTNTPGTGLGTPWDTTTVADGQHTITQAVTYSGGTVEVDTATFTVKNNLPFTFNTGKYEYVFPDGGFYVYDLSNFHLVQHVSMPQWTAIRGVGVVPSTHMLYVSFNGAGGSTGNGSLMKYDLVANTVVWTQNYTHGVDTFGITPDGSTIYMPDGGSSSDGLWYIVNATTGAETGSINTAGVGPHNTIVSLDGTQVYMGPINSNFLAEGNTSTNTVTRDLGPLHQGVRPFTINGKHTLAFTTSNTPSGIGFQVSDTTTGNVLYSVTVPGFTIPSGFTFNSPVHGISLSPNEKEIYLIDTANAYVHVFDVSGLPGTAPTDIADIPLNTNFGGFESPCNPNFNCVQESWIRHTLDGNFVVVSDSGDVINTSTRTVVGAIPQLLNTRKGNMEIDWQSGLPVATSTHFGVGYVTSTTVGPPATITATAGTPQAATVNTAFAVQLQATVLDASNNPVSNVTVNWSAPGSGASGSFAGGVTTSMTNAQGVATAPVFTANGTTGSYPVNASVSGVANPATFSLTNVSASALAVVQTAQNFSATSNTSITVPINTTAGHLLVIHTMNGGSSTATVTITDSASQTWTQTSSGYASSATSNRAAMFYVANSAALTSITATWTASANNIGLVVFEISGAAQTSPADGSVNSSIAGTSVTSLTSGALTTTNANDILIYGGRTQSNETTWTPGSGYTIPANGSNARQGIQYEVVTTTQTGATTSMSWNPGAAGASGIFAAFKATAGPPPPTITATAGTPQSAVVGQAFATQLQVTLKDGMGNPINNATVTWTAPGSGASGTFAGGVNTATTNALGVANAQIFTANSTTGTYNVTATAAGVVTPASFALSNLSAPPATVAATAGSSQSAAVNTAFATQLQATVLDGSGNPVSGVTVTFTVPGSGASGTFAGGVNTAVSNASGIATAVVFTANGTTGSYTVTASAAGASTPASFSMSNISAPPISVVKSAQAFSATSATTITVPITTTVGHLLVVYVMNGGSNTATVTITDSASQTWTQTASGYASSATSNRSAMFYIANSAAVTSVTATWTASANNIGAIVYEISGTALTAPADGSVNSSVSGTGLTSLLSGALTTTNASDILLYGARAQNDQTAWTPGAGYTIPTNGSNTRQGLQYEVVATTQNAVNTTISWNAGTIGAAGIFAAFKSASGASAPISVSVSPTTASIPSGYGTLNVTATLLNDFQNMGATFTLSGSGCGGSTCGTLTNVTLTSVTFNAPAAVPSPAAVILTATSVADPSKWATVTITITQGTLHVNISPTHTAITTSETQQFTATVFNNPQNFTLSYLVDGVVSGNSTVGMISSTGLYTPPSTVGNHTVTAQVQTQSANAPVFVTTFPGVFMRDVDTMRTGANLSETVLTTANVNSTTFGKLLSYPLDGVSDASPLYVANVNIPGQGLYDVVYVETEHDSAYAFDADGTNPNPLWHVTFLNSGGGTTVTTVSPTQTGDTAPNMAESGVTGTPVIDTTTGTIYMVAVTAETTNGTTTFVQRLHALDITTGAEKFNGPAVIQACVPGTGDGSSGGQVCFNGLRENQRAGLLLSNGVVYIAWAAHADHSPYHGWIMGYSASNVKQQVMIYNTSPNGGQGGVWQSGDGLAMDASGRIFFVTGNGAFDANNTGGTEYGDSIVALNTTGTVSDYFTPFDQANMANNDLDMGSGGTLLLPDQPGPFPHEAMSAGKNGVIYVVNRDPGKMGGYNTSNNSQIIQTLQALPGGTFQTGNFKAPVYFNGSVYWSADANNLVQFTVTNGLLSTSPVSKTSASFGYPGCTMQISANGTTNGILWAIERFSVGNQAAGNTAPGVLHAFDATNLATELYNSNQAANNRDNLNDGAAKWAAPLVVNGKVIVASSSMLTIFGLL